MLLVIGTSVIGVSIWRVEGLMRIGCERHPPPASPGFRVTKNRSETAS